MEGIFDRTKHRKPAYSHPVTAVLRPKATWQRREILGIMVRSGVAHTFIVVQKFGHFTNRMQKPKLR